MNHPQLYQVDCNMHNSGKTVAVTKRRVTWRFGVANPTALADGLSGVDCRGHEHEVKLIWSITSGKRSIILDGQEVHFSQGKPLRENKFCFQFHEWGHSFYLIAHVASPIQKTPDFKMNELLIDGRSFHSFPMIYQLGQGRASNRNSTKYLTNSPTLNFAAPPQYDHRNDYIRNSSKASSSVRQESSPRTKSSKSFAVPNLDLLGETKTTVGAPSQGLDLLDVQNDMASASVITTMVAYDEFSPKGPTYQDISSSILQSYSPKNNGDSIEVYSSPAAASTYSTTSQSVPYLSSTPAPHYEEQQSYVTPASKSYVNDSIQELEQSMYNLHVVTNIPSSFDDNDSSSSNNKMTDSLPSPTGVMDVDHALKKICNLDDITQSVLTPYKQKTPSALQPQNMNLPLSQLKSMSSGGQKKEVMRNQHIYQPSHGQHLVVYGQSPPNLQTPMGGQSFNRFALNYSY
jgi:hypothetical protein